MELLLGVHDLLGGVSFWHKFIYCCNFLKIYLRVFFSSDAYIVYQYVHVHMIFLIMMPSKGFLIHNSTYCHTYTKSSMFQFICN